MSEAETHGSTWLGRMLDKRAKRKKEKEETDAIIDESCTCSACYQVIGCSAYDYGKCIWHPQNDPYGLKNREWVDGRLVKKSSTTK